MTEAVHKLGEVLRAAREAKGVDLARVERETKIRERYLSALERGEYRELPGSVYTKGFLRNYGAYLGLDPEYLIDLYRLETSTVSADRPRVPAPPRPIATRRSGALVVTPGVVFAALLTVAVGAFIAYIGWELVNFARTPDLRITDPAANLNAYTETTITLRGETAPNSTVTVSNLPENPTVTADADGSFEVTVELLPGSNVIRLTAHDPVTDRNSETESRTVIVVGDVAGSASPGAVSISVDQPSDGATLSGEVPLSGRAGPGVELQVTASLVEAPAFSFRVEDASGAAVDLTASEPNPPEPALLMAGGDGAFEGTLNLRPGTWDISLSAADGEPVVRRVTVGPAGGLTGILRVVDADSYLEIEEDGTPVADVSGIIASDGDRLELSADDELRIRAGNAGAVRLTVNGIGLGAMGGDGEVVEWRITRSGE